MKQILFSLFFIFLFCILYLSKAIKGKKAIINYYSKYLINSIKVEPAKIELYFSNPITGTGNFYLDCEPGDKIIVNISLKYNFLINKDYFSMQIIFEDKTKYFVNKNNISIHDIQNIKKKSINIFFYIPYETYCKNKNDIIFNNKNNIISFDLQDYIFIKNDKIQSLERLTLNITEIVPSNLIFQIDKKKVNILLPNEENMKEEPIIIKYIGSSISGGGKALNECSFKIISNKFLSNNKYDKKYNSLRKLNNTEDKFFYYNDSIYNNSNASKNIETIERFFREGINIFNINDPFFNDLCIYVEENGNDVVLDDRIDLYFQNYSMCNSNCIISEIDMEKFIYTCKCSEVVVLINDNIAKSKEIDENSFSKETISEELSDIFFETNFEVLSCFVDLLDAKIFANNYGALMTTIFLFIQFISGFFLFRQIQDIRNFLYKEVIKSTKQTNQLNPPVKRRNSLVVNEEVHKQLESGGNSNKNFVINNNINNIISPKFKNSLIEKPKNKRKQKLDNISELSSRKALLKNTKVFDNMIDEKVNNNFLFNKLAKSGKINQPIKKIYPLPKNSNELKIKDIDFPFFESENSSERNIESKKNEETIFSPKNRIPKINKHSMVYVRKNYKDKFDKNELIDYLNSQKTLPQNKLEENKRYSKKAKVKVIKEHKEEKENKIHNYLLDEKEYKLDKNIKILSNKKINKLYLNNNNYENNKVLSDNFAEKTDRENKKELEKDKPKIKLRKCKTKKSGDFRRKKSELGVTRNKENNTNNTVQALKKKDYDDDDLNEMDFDEALIYDHRGFWQLCWMEIKERQLIINTFFVKERLKPFSIKLIVFIFSITCYFVINGFLYDTKYVSKKLKRAHKSVYFFFVDSIKRIIYSSIVGALVNVIVGLLFRSDKTLRKAQNKYKDNKILLNGEVVKIFKNMKITNFLFTLVNFILMLAVWIYIFCFCGVYRNCQIDWFESACIIIGVMQLFPIIISLLLALLRIIGLRLGMESCFRITAWISDNT